MSVSQQELITKLYQLPSLPGVVQDVIASFGDPALDIPSLVYKISLDQGLSAKLLRVANSSFYGLPRKIGSVQDAVVVLGFDVVRSMVLSAGIAKTLPSTPGSLFDRHAYWRKSFRVAVFSKAMARMLRDEPQLAFTAGMFHDIGLLVLDLCLPQQFAELLQVQAATGEDLIGVARRELGFDHASTGAEIIRRWNFPVEIERVAADCLRLEKVPIDPMAGIVHLSILLERGLTGADLMESLPQRLKDTLNISWERIEECLPTRVQLEVASALVADQ
jgi:putative nucleotidyltransferase with HDIG domain